MKKTFLALFLATLGVLVYGSAQAATLNISPTTNTVAAGANFTVNITLDTQGAAIDGADIYSLNFNPSILEVVDSNSSLSGVQVQPGSILPITVVNTANNSTGKIQFSQASSGGNRYTGSGVLATVTFKGKAAGTSAISFDFTAGSTADSNVAGNGADVLSSVVNSQATVTGINPNPPPPPGPEPTPPAPQPTPPQPVPPGPTPQPTPQPTPPATPGNKLPVGYFDGVSADGMIKGWAYDPDDSSNSGVIHLYIDGKAGTGTLLSGSATTVFRSDVNGVYGVFGNHGFEIMVPENFRDGKTHALYAYAIDQTAANQSVLLSGSPKSFQLNSGTQPTPTPMPVPPPPPVTGSIPVDGTLIKDSGNPAIYVMEYGQKRPFGSFAVFTGLQYKTSNIITMNTSGIPTGPGLFTASQRHPRGALVVQNGTVYFMGALVKYPFPSATVFLSWGARFQDVVPANSFDASVEIGAVLQVKQ